MFNATTKAVLCSISCFCVLSLGLFPTSIFAANRTIVHSSKPDEHEIKISDSYE